MGMGHKFKKFGPLFVRIGLGAAFIAHGSQKVLGIWGGKGLQATIDGFVTGMGMPVWQAYAVTFGEFLGGIAIAVGFLTRLAGLGLATIMAGAMYTVHLPNGFFADAGGIELPFYLFMMALSLVFSGAGTLSLDCALFGKKGCCPGKSGSQPGTQPTGGA